MIRKASLKDVKQLVALMGEFYRESAVELNLSMDERQATEAFTTFLSNEHLGRAWFIEAHGEVAGYVVMAFYFSIEYGGLVAVLDDFFVKPAFRGDGLGTLALAEVRTFCEQEGVRVMQLETYPAALGIYKRAGFVDTKRLPLRLKLGKTEEGS